MMNPMNPDRRCCNVFNTATFCFHSAPLLVLIVSGVMSQCLSAGTLQGAASSVSGNRVVLGDGARAEGQSTVAVGSSAFANADFATALGATTNANSVQTTAVGSSALADQLQATAMGSFAQAIGEFSTAVGGSAQIEAAGGTAVGAHSFIEAADATALGRDSFVTEAGVGSVALGSHSVANEANVVSVGDAELGVTRRMTNMAPAVRAYDAVNLGQLEQGLQGVRDEAFAGVAAAAALNPALPSQPGKTAVAMGAATYRGEHAVAVSVAHRVLNSRHHLQLNGGVAYDSGQHALGKVGVSWEF